MTCLRTMKNRKTVIFFFCRIIIDKGIYVLEFLSKKLKVLGNYNYVKELNN